MMIYPGTWKTVLILSHGLDTSWAFFLLPTNVSLWDVNLTVEQNPLKDSGLVSGHRVLLVSRVLAGHTLLACMHHLLLEQPCHYVQNQSYIPYCYLAQEQEGLSHQGPVLWQKEHRGIGHSICSCNLFLLVYHAEIAVRNVIFSFPPVHWNSKWHTLLFTIPSIPQVLHTCFITNVGNEWLVLIPLFDSKSIVICLLLKISNFCLTLGRTKLLQI